MEIKAFDEDFDYCKKDFIVTYPLQNSFLQSIF